MSQLIDADALVEKAYWHSEHPSVDDLFAEGVDAVDVSDIDNAPTIEAEPVRHGRWVNTHSDSEFVQCCLCKYPVYAAWNVTNYCPNCGAKMDLEE